MIMKLSLFYLSSGVGIYRLIQGEDQQNWLQGLVQFLTIIRSGKLESSQMLTN